MRLLRAFLIQCLLTTIIQVFAAPEISYDTPEQGAIDEPLLELGFDFEHNPDQDLVVDGRTEPCSPSNDQPVNKKRQTAACDAKDTLENEESTSNSVPSNINNPTQNKHPVNGKKIVPNLNPSVLGGDGIKCPDHKLYGPRKAICDSGKKEERVLDDGGSTLLRCFLCNILPYVIGEV